MVTLKSIAERAGVSVHAVSRVLNGQNKENRPSAIARAKKIRDIANELGYRPNAAAQAMKHGSFKSVMLLMSQEPSSSFMTPEVQISMQQTLNRLGYKLMFTILPDRVSAEEEFPRFFQENCVDGVLVGITKKIPAWLGDLLNKMHTPKIWVGSKQSDDCVRHDDFGSGRDAVERLAELGHKRIVFLDMLGTGEEPSEWHFSHVDRMQGYLQGMKDAGLEPTVVRPAYDLDPREHVEFVERKVFNAHDPTAVLCYGMGPGARSILYACAKASRQVPEELSIIAWTHERTTENGVPITAYLPSKLDVGRISAELIHERMQSPEATTEAVVLPFDFHQGGSIGPVRKNNP